MSRSWDPVGDAWEHGGWIVQEETERQSAKYTGPNRYRFKIKTPHNAAVITTNEGGLFDLAELLDDVCDYIEDRGTG